MAEALGVDVGGVIIERVDDEIDTSVFVNDSYLWTPAKPNVFAAIKQLVGKRFGNRVFLVSKLGKQGKERTLRWLAYQSFYEMTGVKCEHVYFCRERREKADICEKLGITHFVDDRLEVLTHLITTVKNLYLFQPDPDEVRQFLHFLHRVHQVNSWQEILADILP